jgi:hypothetical protein
MKKVTIKFPHNGRRITEFVTNLIDELNNNAAGFASMYNGMKEMTECGDIWFRNYEHNGENIDCVFILDSDEAVTKMADHRAFIETATGFGETTVEEMSFDEFAAFAADRDETWVDHPRKTELGGDKPAELSGSVL